MTAANHAKIWLAPSNVIAWLKMLWPLVGCQTTHLPRLRLAGAAEAFVGASKVDALMASEREEGF